MNMTQCYRYDKCSAPICPLDDEMEKRVVYNDDPICAIKPEALKEILGKKLKGRYKRYVKINLEAGGRFTPWREVEKKLCL